MKRHLLIPSLCLWYLVACRTDSSEYQQRAQVKHPPEAVSKPASPADTSQMEKDLIEKGLVNVNSLDSSIRVALHYATDQNFLHKAMYQGLRKCYLPCEVCIKLCNAQYYLKKEHPYYSIIVFDAVRPLSIQEKMWKELDMPAALKINYIAHPKDISLHNYGAAVDVGIISNDGVLLDMGTAFDCFDSLSEPKWEAHFLKTGQLTRETLGNRLVLRKAMLKAGFLTITSEWWHFNADTKAMAAAKFGLVE